MLKPYFVCSTRVGSVGEVKLVALVTSAGVVSTPSLVEEGGEEPVNAPDDCVMQGRLKNIESLSNLDRLLGHCQR